MTHVMTAIMNWQAMRIPVTRQGDGEEVSLPAFQGQRTKAIPHRDRVVVLQSTVVEGRQLVESAVDDSEEVCLMTQMDGG